MGLKRFKLLTIRRAMHTVSWHDGVKTHPDGSDFFDIKIHSNQREMNTHAKELRRAGYVETEHVAS